MNKSFNRNQLLALCTLVLLSPTLRLFPGLSARLAGRSAWLSALAALPVLLLYLWLLCRLMAARQTGEGLAELSLRALGDRAGRAALALFTLWLLLYCGFVLRAGADRFVVGVFPRSSPAVFSVSLGLACALAALGPVRSLVRMAKMLLPLVLGILLILLLAALRSIDGVNLFPITGYDALPTLLGAVPVLDVLALGLYLPCFLVRDQAPEPGAYLRWGRWLLLMALGLTAISAAVIGTFGAELASRLSMPFFTLVRNLIFFRSFERVEALVVSLWIFPDFLLASALLWAAKSCLGQLLGHPEARWLPPLCGALAILAALLIGPDGASLENWSELYIPLGNLTVAFLLLPTLYIVGKVKKSL